MPKAVPALLSALALFVLAGCGGSGSGSGNGVEPQPVLTMEAIEVPSVEGGSKEAFVDAADQVCREAAAVFAQSPVLGSYAPGIGAEMKQNVAKGRGRIDKLSQLEAPPALAADYESFLALLERQVAVYRDLSKVATDDDQPKIDAGFAQLSELAERRTALADKIGFADCGRFLRVEAEETIVMDLPDGEYPEPKETARKAARDWLELQASGDCAAIRERVHSQFGEYPEADCKGNVEFAKQAELVGVADYGIASMAVYDAGDLGTIDTHFVIDEGGRYGFVGNRFLDPEGLAPPVEGYDAQEVVDRAVEAIRDDAPEAFNATLTEDHTGNFTGFTVDGKFDSFGTDEVNGPIVVESIRADEEAEPELIGADIDSAYFLLNADGRSFLLVANHQPGTDTGYAFTGYWALTKAG